VQDELTGWFYDLAMDPSGLERLVDDWERLVSSLRPTTPFEAPRLLDDDGMLSHYTRAAAIMERMDATVDPVEAALVPYGHLQAAVVTAALAVRGANDAARSAFGSGDLPMRFPVHPDDEDLLRDAVAQVLVEAAETAFGETRAFGT